MKKIANLKVPSDPRWYQIFVLSSLLVYGLWFLNFPLNWQTMVTIVLTAQLTQLCCTRLWKLPKFDPRSAFISSLSLCLLLRTEVIVLAALAAVITIASKFFIQIRYKHIFNPTNFSLTMMLLISDQVWVSSGQWGSTGLLAFFIACCGGLVLYRTTRSDITIAFVFAYAGILFGRAWWLSDPVTIPLHYLQSGAFLLFAFFMISDPKTIPDSRSGRILFACWVAVLAAYIQFALYQPNALLWALVCSSPFVPVIDKLLGGERYRWPIMRRFV